MRAREKTFRTANIIFMLAITLSILFAIALISSGSYAVPQGASITSSSTENASIAQAAAHTAKGGSFTTLTLNVSSQTSKWKAYVGNVSGKITLQNSNNQSIYDWDMTTVQGEVYVSRNDSISFTTLTCADETDIETEETALNIDSDSDDSINKTFNSSIHKSFVVGGSGTIQHSTCRSIATYIDDASQTPDEDADFQEILLHDGNAMVFVGLLENSKLGFNNNNYDFQMIIPDDPGDTSNTYYFYAELG